MVTGLAAEAAPTFADPKSSFAGLTEILGGGTCPESFTETVGFLGSFEEILRTALFLVKGVVGLKLIVRTQAPPGVIGSGHPSDGLTLNSGTFEPERLTDETARSDLPVFPMVSVLEEETPPAFTEPKSNAVGFTEIFAGESALDGPADREMHRGTAHIKRTAQFPRSRNFGLFMATTSVAGILKRFYTRSKLKVLMRNNLFSRILDTKSEGMSRKYFRRNISGSISGSGWRPGNWATLTSVHGDE